MIHAATKSATTFESQAKISLGSMARNTARIVSGPDGALRHQRGLVHRPGGVS